MAQRKKRTGYGIKKAQPAAMAPEAFARIRFALGFTQKQMAEELGVRTLTVGLWESGKAAINKGRALAIQGLVARTQLTLSERAAEAETETSVEVS